jgi:hypothetical protein
MAMHGGLQVPWNEQDSDIVAIRELLSKGERLPPLSPHLFKGFLPDMARQMHAR